MIKNYKEYYSDKKNIRITYKSFGDSREWYEYYKSNKKKLYYKSGYSPLEVQTWFNNDNNSPEIIYNALHKNLSIYDSDGFLKIQIIQSLFEIYGKLLIKSSIIPELSITFEL
jgi:hypothetical protein